MRQAQLKMAAEDAIQPASADTVAMPRLLATAQEKENQLSARGHLSDIRRMSTAQFSLEANTAAMQQQQDEEAAAAAEAAMGAATVGAAGAAATKEEARPASCRPRPIRMMQAERHAQQLGPRHQAVVPPWQGDGMTSGARPRPSSGAVVDLDDDDDDCQHERLRI